MDAAAKTKDLVSLLMRSSRGDRTAFADLYKLTSAKLFGIICRILQDRELAAEALQESFVSIWIRAADYDPAVASPIAWMATIARNRAIDVKRLGAERISVKSEPPNVEMPSLMPDPLAATEQSQTLRRLTKCLGVLPQDRREMVFLAYYKGWSREEIGNRFEKSVNTVKTVLRRSLALLKECLDRDD